LLPRRRNFAGIASSGGLAYGQFSAGAAAKLKIFAPISICAGRRLCRHGGRIAMALG
jgi:hypothetical protein